MPEACFRLNEFLDHAASIQIVLTTLVCMVVGMENNQFHHKVKGPDDVTYGCYGYVDPSNRKHLVYYVADKMGYRIIFQNRPTKIFTARLADSLNKLAGSVKDKDYDENVVEWNNLYMPDSCFRLNENIDSASSNQVYAQEVAPHQTSTPHVQYSLLSTSSVQPPTTRSPLPFPTQYVVPTNPSTFGDKTGAGSTEQQTSDYDSNTRGGSPELPNTAGQSESSTSQSNEKIAQLLIQMEAVNKQIIALNILMAGLTNNGTANTA
uniref:Uncharacterized protein n=1 Tax=Anopheles dirus TaxID=7168 RepID=A0A3F2YVX7_9DIPT